MSFAAMILLLTAAAQADEAPIIVRGYPWAPFISPMGEPFRSRSTGEAPIARWFGQADRNRDGFLTQDELSADAARFFMRLDSNQDAQIDPTEVRTYEWEIAPEIQTSENWRRARGQPAPVVVEKTSRDDGLWLEDPARPKGDQYDGYDPDGLQGAARYGLLNIPQPVTSVDADFNRSITKSEFLAAAQARFRALDASGAGQLALADLEARLPTRPEGKQRRDRKKLKDTRIGLPFPKSE
jgi:hypothetical protein